MPVLSNTSAPPPIVQANPYGQQQQPNPYGQPVQQVPPPNPYGQPVQQVPPPNPYGQPVQQVPYGQPQYSYDYSHMNSDLPGRKLIKVAAIIMIVFAAINLLSGLYNLGTAESTVSDLTEICRLEACDEPGLSMFCSGYCRGEFDSEGLTQVMILLAVITVVASAYSLVVGIMGAKFCNDGGKVKLLYGLLGVYVAVWLGELIASYVLSQQMTEMLSMPFMDTMMGLTNVTMFVCAPISLILPILILVGVIKNSKAA
jgi:hypothetical protein